MLEQLLVLGPLAHLLLEAHVDERLEVVAERGAVEARRVERQYGAHHLEVTAAVLVRVLACCQLDQRDAQRPDVRADVVHRVARVGRVDALRRDVARRARVAARVRVRVDQVAADAEVTQLDLARLVYEDI